MIKSGTHFKFISHPLPSHVWAILHGVAWCWALWNWAFHWIGNFRVRVKWSHNHLSLYHIDYVHHFIYCYVELLFCHCLLFVVKYFSRKIFDFLNRNVNCQFSIISSLIKSFPKFEILIQDWCKNFNFP